ncbi:hypothetical protein NE619_12935 [Anaerovorax odorimutans]|uniref:DUF6873 domain-containing protein n=1 Tax=Anaerovorax odorimutans TaxID=109327 RepID=A0ABT1RR29_9FIRM|nr:hypothetical protein [Anaerovorax odorimutans]MCQ4637632.1 hypothetical protein [Anaerovorax odorimutans]
MGRLYLSETANSRLIAYLQKKENQISIITKTKYTYDPVSSHPDIYICGMGPGQPVFFGLPEKLGPDYPANIIYNAACTGKFFIHNLKYTDSELLALAGNMEKIHVSQGYTKCNIVIVDETSIITADQGIYRACRDKLDVLLISPGHVKLLGFPYGFLGGASGRIGNEIVFNGNLGKHPDYKSIAAFVEDRGLKLSYFDEYDLEDIGSIIEAK